MSKFPIRKFLKASIISIVVLLLLIGGAGSWFSYYYKKVILQKLPDLAAKATDSLYEVHIEDIRINIFNQQVTVYGLSLIPNPIVVNQRKGEGKLPAMLVEAYVPEINIWNVKWRNALKEKELSCSRAVLEHPQIKLLLQDSISHSKPKPVDEHEKLQDVWVKRAIINDPQLKITGNAEAPFVTSVAGGKIVLHNWRYSPGTRDSTRFFYAAQADMMLDSVSHHTENNLYSWSAERLHFKTHTNSLSIDQLRYKGIASYDSLYKIIGHRTSLFNFTAAHATLSAFNWKKAMSTGHLLADGATLIRPELEIYASKVPPRNPNVLKGLFPDDMLQAIKQPFYLPFIYFKDGIVVYREKNAKTGNEGTILFNDLNGTGVHISNDATAKRAPAYIQATGHLFNRSPFLIAVRFNTLDTSGIFAASARLYNLTAAQIRSPVEGFAIASVKSLQMPYATFSINGNKDSATGDFIILYDKLRIKIKQFDTLSQRVRGKGVLSFLANNIFLHTSNPAPGEEIRNIHVVVGRADEPFFLYIWKILFSGIQETALRDRALIMRFRDRRIKHMQKPKKHRIRDWMDRQQQSSMAGQ